MRDHGAAIAWAGEHLGGPVVAVRELLDGSTSTLLALTTADGVTGVLRLITNEPWRTHGNELATRECLTQRQLVGTGVPAPRTLALDAAGEVCGHPAHLMTLLPGSTDLTRADDVALGAMADLLASIHRVVVTPAAREYQTWAPPVKFVVPTWAGRPDVWRAAFDVLRQPAPAHEPVLLHRDFSPRNLLWGDSRAGGGITGVVDWVETSSGPAWLDVAHCRTNLVLQHDVERGAAFAAAFVRLTGCEPAPYFDVMDVVGFLPTPGRPRPEAVTDPAARRRLEQHLVDVLGG